MVNGEYYHDYDPARPIGHYGQTRRIDTAGMRKRYEALLKADARALLKQSPLTPGAGAIELPRAFFDHHRTATHPQQPPLTLQAGSCGPV